MGVSFVKSHMIPTVSIQYNVPCRYIFGMFLSIDSPMSLVELKECPMSCH